MADSTVEVILATGRQGSSRLSRLMGWDPVQQLRRRWGERRTADGTEITLPQSLLRLVVSAANNLAAGRAVMAIPAEVTLTPAEAAELLGLSRPFVARLLERGDIPSELLPESRHRRIKLEDVLAFQDRRERRAEGRRRIADIAATADIPYLCLLFVARVFLDTNVLFPFSVMDLMLALTEEGIHDVMWTGALLDEWERVIVEGQRRSPDAAAAITATIREFFADTRISAESYDDLCLASGCATAISGLLVGIPRP